MVAYVYQNQSDLSEGKKKKDSKSAVAEYLAQPRKKRKNYIVFVVGPNFDADLLKDLRGFCRSKFPRYSLSQPKNNEELQRQLLRNLSLMVVDPKFFENESLDVIKQLKEAKKDSATKILFLTRDPSSLLKNYQKAKFSSSENDDFIDINDISKNHIFNRMKNLLDMENLPPKKKPFGQQGVYYQVYDSETRNPGFVQGISIYGANLKSVSGKTFLKKDQIIVHLPLGNIKKQSDRDILRLAARIKSIDIASKSVSLSWIDLNESKKNLLLKLISSTLTKSLKMAG